MCSKDLKMQFLEKWRPFSFESDEEPLKELSKVPGLSTWQGLVILIDPWMDKKSSEKSVGFFGLDFHSKTRIFLGKTVKPCFFFPPSVLPAVFSLHISLGHLQLKGRGLKQKILSKMMC